MVQVALLLWFAWGQATSGKPAQTAQRAQQDNQTYQSVFQGLPWDSEKSGPLVAPCPRTIVHSSALSEIGRKTARIGSLTAIVPTTMITLNTHFSEAPNLYDGLPREAKVLYLLTLLDSDQWRKLTNDGIALADCHGDQRAVMQSILPNPFKVGTATLIAPNGYTGGGADTAKQLSDAEREQVKLRVTKHLQLQLPLADNGGYTGASVQDFRAIGSKFPVLINDDGDEFGHHIKIESANVPKKSQLDLTDRRLDVKIPLVEHEMLDALIGRISSATGLELYADHHYTNMDMVERGKEASARDLLQALSLGVAGTYRRVQDAYVLTNDLEGMAAHQARIATWEDDLDKIVMDRENLWRSVVAKGNQLGKVKFPAGAYDKLTQTELANLADNDQPDSDTKYINTAQASDAVRREIQEFRSGGSMTLDSSRVGVMSSTQAHLVLPDGSMMPFSSSWLGQTSMFTPHPYVPPGPGAPPKLPMTPSANLKALVFHADKVQSAQDAVAHVKQLGIGELWLETRDPAVLRAAVEFAGPLGVKVWVALRPWVAGPSIAAQDIDRTATGDHGPAFDARKADYVALGKFWDDVSAYPSPTRDQLSPKSTTIPQQWASLTQLASTKGVTGAVLLDAYPIGYAKDVSRSIGSYYYNGAMETFLAYGYSESQRLAYLRAEHVDPADMEDESMRTRVSLREVWSGAWAPGQPFVKWQQTKGIWIHDSLSDLVNGLAKVGCPIFISGQPVKKHIPPYGQMYLFSWSSGKELPTNAEDYVGTEVAKASDLAVIAIQYDENPDRIGRVATNVAAQFAKSGKPVVLDFSSVPPSKLESVLKEWLKK